MPDITQTTRRYRPSSGTEGAIFMSHWCGRCRRDDAFQRGEGDSCEIAAATMAYTISSSEYPPEWTYAADGSPCCTAFETVEDVGLIRDRRQEALHV